MLNKQNKNAQLSQNLSLLKSWRQNLYKAFQLATNKRKKLRNSYLVQ